MIGRKLGRVQRSAPVSPWLLRHGTTRLSRVQRLLRSPYSAVFTIYDTPRVLACSRVACRTRWFQRSWDGALLPACGWRRDMDILDRGVCVTPWNCWVEVELLQSPPRTPQSPRARKTYR